MVRRSDRMGCGGRSAAERPRRVAPARLLALALVLALAGACRERAPAPAEERPAPPPSWDDREAAALHGAGRAIPDVVAPDGGIRISDAEAALLDEALCEPACQHLFDLLAAEQRERLAADPDALELFLGQLDELREKRLKGCVGDCRRWADPAMVRCVRTARDRAALDRCEF